MSYTVGSTRVINTTSASGTTDFTFTFPYIKEAHIEVYKDYTKLNQGTGATEYQVITNVSPKLIRLGTATASANVRLEIRRNSSLDTPLVDYADGSTLTANDLDTSALQSLYIDQELKDSQFQTVTISESTGLPSLGNKRLTEVSDPTAAQDAATKNYVDTKDALKLTKAGDSMTGALAMGTNKVTGVGDPTAAQDAATKNYVDTKVFSSGQLANVVVTTTNITDGTIVAGDLATGTLDGRYYTETELDAGQLDNRYYTETELDAGQLDNRYYTETESDARYFNVSTGDTIKDGDAFPDNDTTIATTAAINDRIIDLVDDVGGFVPIANETSFPTANPDVNNGTGTLVSIKAFAASHTPSGGTVTIANGAGSGNTVTITGCGTTVLAADYGGIVETTATLHTYSFHRLVPKATEVTSVATNVSPNIANINTVANNISDVNNFADLYQIASSAPSTDGGGNALADGDLYFNTTNNELQVYNGSAWQGGVTPSTTLMPKTGGTFTGSIGFNDNIYARFGGDNDLEIYHLTGVPGHTYVKHNGLANFTIDKTGASGNIDIKFGTDSAASFIKDGAVELYHDGSKKFETTSTGTNITGVHVDDGATHDGDVSFNGASYNSLWDKSDSAFKFDDNAKIKVGTGADLEIYHDGTDSWLNNTTGNLTIRDSATAVKIQAPNIVFQDDSGGETIAKFIADGGVELYYDDTIKLQTRANDVWCRDDLIFADSDKIKLGDGSDLQIYSDGTDGFMVNHVGGGIYLRANTNIQLSTNASDGGADNALKCINNGAVELYWDGSKKFETTSGGATVAGTISAGAASFTDDGSAGPVINISGDDTNVWYGRIGNETYNTSLNTGFRFYVEDDGDVRFENKGNAEYLDWSIGSHDGTTGRYDIYTTAAGAVYLYNSGNVRLTTTSSGVTVTGSVTDDKGDVRKIPANAQTSAYTLVASDAGKHINITTGGVTVAQNIFATGDAITIINNSGSDQTLTQGSGVTMYNSADASTGNRTLAGRGMATLLCTGANEFYISGAGLS